MAGPDRRGAPAAPIEPFRPPGLDAAAVAKAALQAITEPARMLGDSLGAIHGGIRDAAQYGVDAIVDPIARELSDAAPQRTAQAPSAAPVATPSTAVQPAQQQSGAPIQAYPIPASQASQMVTTGQTTTSPAMSPAVGAELARQSDAITGAQSEAIRQASVERDQISQKTSEVRQKLRDDQVSLEATYGKRARAATARLSELDAVIERKQQELDTTDYKVLGGMSRMSQALLAVTAALEAGAAASLRRPHNASRLIQQAIDADLREYKIRLDKRLRSMNASKEQRAEAFKAWQVAEDQQRTAAANAAQLQLADLAGQKSAIGDKLDAANTALALEGKNLGFKAALAEKTTGRTVTQRQLVGSGAGGVGAQLGKEEAKKLKEKIGLMSQISQLQDAWVKYRPYSAASGLRGTKSGEYEAMRVALGRQIAKSMNSGALTDKDVDEIKQAIPGGIDVSSSFGLPTESFDSGRRKLSNLRSSFAAKIAGDAFVTPQVMQYVPPQFREDVFTAYRKMGRSGTAPGARESLGGVSR